MDQLWEVLSGYAVMRLNHLRQSPISFLSSGFHGSLCGLSQGAARIRGQSQLQKKSSCTCCTAVDQTDPFVLWVVQAVKLLHTLQY